MSRPETRRTRRSWWVLAAVVGLALVGAAALVVRSPANEPSADIAPPAATPADEAAWFRIRSGDEGLALEIGTLASGLTATEPIGDKAGPTTADGSIVGVAEGTVVFMSNDADESLVMALDATTGESAVLMRTTSALIAGRMSPSGATAYVVTAERDDGRVEALFAIDVASGATRQLSDLRPAALHGVHGFHVSLDGSRLAIDGCRAAGCEVRLVDVSSGASTQLFAGERAVGLIGLTSRYAVTPPPCDDRPCGHWIIELATRDRMAEPLAADRYVSSAVLRGPDGHDLVVGQLTGIASWGTFPRGETAPPILEVVDLTERRAVDQVHPDLYALDIVRTIDPTIGIELPPGWVLVSGITHRHDELVSYFAVDLSTGRVQPLPPLGESERRT